MGERERAALTEPMFYVLMSFLHRDMCGIEIAEFVERRTGGRLRLAPAMLRLKGQFKPGMALSGGGGNFI